MDTRTVTALVGMGDRYLGAAQPFDVPGPWWAYVEAITAHLDRLLGVPTAVVRLLHANRADQGRGGPVTYHVEALAEPRPGVLDGAPNQAWPAVLADHPLRASWARPAGVRDLLDWAAGAAGAPLSGRPVQVKSWNLSCLYRLPVGSGRGAGHTDDAVWAKANAHFGGDEATYIRLVRRHDPGLAPAVVATDPARRRFLMAHAPGTDCWDTDAETVQDVVRRWVAVQAAIACGGPSATRGIRASDPHSLLDDLPRLLDGDAGAQLTAEELTAASRLADRLPELITALEQAGLPRTLVHGDLHPGNWRSDGTSRMVIDWAEAHIGHPAADIQKLRRWLHRAELRDAAEAAWVDAWRSHLPGSDPERALAPMAVLSHLGDAALYQQFLDNIEPDERVYHEGDAADEIREALEACAAFATR